MAGSANLRSVGSSDSEQPDPWLTLLLEKLTPGWRSSEWDPETQLFTGDADNPRTTVYRCRDDSCSMTGSTRDQYCQQCLYRRRTGRTSQRVSQHFFEDPPRCKVHNRSGQCLRPTSSVGFCRSHYALFAASRKRQVSEEEFVANARPLPYPGICRVLHCPAEISFLEAGLCGTHHRSLQRVRSEDPNVTSEQFIARQPPVLRHSQFSLQPVTETVAAELLCILQHRDTLGFAVAPPRIRRIVEHARGRNSLLDLPTLAAADLGKTQRAFNTVLETLRYEMNGVDPLSSDRWGPAELATLPSRNRAEFKKSTVCDWTKIKCVWLRAMGKNWARMTQPYSEDINLTIKALSHASNALVGKPAFKDQSKAGYAEAKRIHDYIYKLKDKEGARYHTSTAGGWMTEIRTVIGFLRAADEIADIPQAFTFSGINGPAKTVSNADDELGRSLPLSLLDFLEENLATLTPAYSPSLLPVGWTNDDYGSMLSTIYLVLRDTGRRPTEVAKLKRNCLRIGADGQPVLVYDNTKAGRLGVRLAIGDRAADVIRTWRKRVDVIAPARASDYLFPALSRRLIQPTHNFRKERFSAYFRKWVRSIPDLPDRLQALASQKLPVDLDDIVPYALRHSYAQEHADAGVDMETLQELMGHKDPKTTQCYYRISAKRKRTAIDLGHRYRMDRRGRLQPVPTNPDDVYERRSVPTVLGHCTESENVAAGGTACRIRFQCAGCAHWEPDPSFLPEIREEIVRLKAAAREVQANESAAPQIVDNLLYNAAQLESALRHMETEIGLMPPEERAAYHRWASSVTEARRNKRLADPVKLLPLTVVEQGGAQ